MAVRMPRPQLCVRLSGNLDRVPLLRRFGSAVLTCEAKSEKKDKPEQEVTEITERLEFSHAESSVPSVTSCSILLCAFGSALLFPVADEVLLDRLRARLSKPNRGTQGRSPVCIPPSNSKTERRRKPILVGWQFVAEWSLAPSVTAEIGLRAGDEMAATGR
jgi:hypothetical protein